MEDLVSKVRKNVDKKLASFLASKEQTDLMRSIQETISSGGKRIRPTLLYAAYTGGGGTDVPLIFSVGAAIELFHTFALIHDDILDNSSTRRGKPTIYKKAGLSSALLAGDLAILFANELFYSAINGMSEAQRVSHQWQLLQEEVIKGEYLDMSLTHSSSVTESNIMEMMEYKTARYSFIRPLLIGSLLAGGSLQIQQSLADFGKNIGIAFQIQDDILGIFGNETITGKSVDSDILEGKMTLLMVRLIASKSPSLIDRDKLRDPRYVRNELKKREILKKCEEDVQYFLKKAIAAVEQSLLSESTQKFLLEFTQHIKSRVM